MTKEQLLTQLFDAHVKDLNDVFPASGDVFVCPICLGIFSKEAISQGLLSDGHVWPKKIRLASQKASTMRVLLCKECNNTAGSFGDRQMQIYEKVKNGEKTGEIYGPRLVQIFKNPDEEPVNLHVNVTRHLNNNSITVTGRIDRDFKWLDGSPEDQARIQEVLETGKQVNIVVHPYKDLKPELVGSGWVTAAYLMAFFRLGYRYILTKKLNIVRTYIVQSFDRNSVKKQVNPDEKYFTIKEHNSEYFTDPELLFIIPYEKDKLVYLQINCCEYEIRLPFWYDRSVLDWFIRSRIPNWDIELQNMLNTGKYLYLRIDCAKISPHECLYDFIMGKPIQE